MQVLALLHQRGAELRAEAGRLEKQLSNSSDVKAGSRRQACVDEHCSGHVLCGLRLCALLG